MEETNQFNKWSNYLRWALAVWLENDAALYHQWRDIARDIMQDFISLEDAELELVQLLKRSMLKGKPEGLAGVYGDLLEAAIEDVEWMENAASIFTAIRDENLQTLNVKVVEG